MTSFIRQKFVNRFFRNFPLLISFNMKVLERVASNNKKAESLLNSLKSELSLIKTQLKDNKREELVKENKVLQVEIQEKIAQLTALETRNGKVQLPLPGQVAKVTICTDLIESSKSAATISNEAEKPPSKQKEKKVKKEKPAAAAADSNKSAPTSEAPIDVGRLDFRIGKIVKVTKHPDADSLYLEKIDCGEDKPRTVVSGLVKFVPIEEMQNRIVVLLCNLKPAKMRGITSEAMVMCASSPEKVEVLTPPQGAVPGDLVYCDGYERKPDVQLNPKKKIFETCAPDLKTNDNLVACYKDSPLYVPGKGNILSTTLKNVPVK